jgi:5-hydroxyisourate hydrolase
MSAITTHVLDLASGKPAANVRVQLEVQVPGKGWVKLAERLTDADGRVRDFVPAGSPPDPGRYRLTFDIGAFQAARGVGTFWSEVPIVFDVSEQDQHIHVPLLLSPFGYSTYRGS